MLRIHLEQLKEKSLSLTVDCPAGRFPVLRQMIDEGACEFAAPIRIQFKAARIGEWVEVDGSFQTSLRLTCSRCLTQFLGPLQSGFSLTYTQIISAAGRSDPSPAPVEAEEGGLMGFRGEVIDLGDGIQEQVILALPLRPLCSEACRGLCPQCGADLNQGACRCGPARADSAFASLQKLKLS
jgi:uncharacterized protein